MGADMAAAGQLPPGLGSDGLMSGVQPGQAGLMPGGRPTLSSISANMDTSGRTTASIGSRSQRAV